MSKLERLSSLIGVALLGFAAYLVASERQRMEARNQQAPLPVEVLGEKLKEAWAGHHTP